MGSWVKYPITGGATYIDLADLDLASSRRWHVNDSGYAVWRGIIGSAKRTLRLHRLIAGTPHGLITDHLNHDRLDNRRGNLRVCTQQENMRNLSDQGNGYWYHRKNRNWVVEVNGKHRGCFDTEAQAARFADLVRAGLADTKPRPVRTHCKYGHSLANAYDYGKGKNCVTCQSERSKSYYKRRRASQLKS